MYSKVSTILVLLPTCFLILIKIYQNHKLWSILFNFPTITFYVRNASDMKLFDHCHWMAVKCLVNHETTARRFRSIFRQSFATWPAYQMIETKIKREAIFMMQIFFVAVVILPYFSCILFGAPWSFRTVPPGPSWNARRHLIFIRFLPFHSEHSSGVIKSRNIILSLDS